MAAPSGPSPQVGEGSVSPFLQALAAVRSSKVSSPLVPLNPLGSAPLVLRGGDCQNFSSHGGGKISSPSSVVGNKSFAQVVSSSDASLLSPPTISKLPDGGLRISFSEETYSMVAAKHSSTLVARFGAKRPIVADFKRFVNKAVSLAVPPVIGLMDPRHISIHCSIASDANALLSSLPRSCDGFTFNLERWSDGFSHRKDSPIVPVWIRLPGLPLPFFNSEALIAIGNGLGNIVHVDPMSANLHHTSFARICVELDLSLPLLDSFTLAVEGVRSKKQFILYEGNLLYCSSCKRRGHSLEACQRRRPSFPAKQMDAGEVDVHVASPRVLDLHGTLDQEVVLPSSTDEQATAESLQKEVLVLSSYDPTSPVISQHVEADFPFAGPNASFPVREGTTYPCSEPSAGDMVPISSKRSILENLSNPIGELHVDLNDKSDPDMTAGLEHNRLVPVVDVLVTETPHVSFQAIGLMAHCHVEGDKPACDSSRHSGSHSSHAINAPQTLSTLGDDPSCPIVLVCDKPVKSVQYHEDSHPTRAEAINCLNFSLSQSVSSDLPPLLQAAASTIMDGQSLGLKDINTHVGCKDKQPSADVLAESTCLTPIYGRHVEGSLAFGMVPETSSPDHDHPDLLKDGQDSVLEPSVVPNHSWAQEVEDADRAVLGSNDGFQLPLKVVEQATFCKIASQDSLSSASSTKVVSTSFKFLDSDSSSSPHKPKKAKSHSYKNKLKISNSATSKSKSSSHAMTLRHQTKIKYLRDPNFVYEEITDKAKALLFAHGMDPHDKKLLVPILYQTCKTLEARAAAFKRP